MISTDFGPIGGYELPLSGCQLFQISSISRNSQWSRQCS
jgi:hypothetical protein